MLKNGYSSRRISTLSSGFIRQEMFEHRGQLLGKATRLSDRFQLPVDILGITLLANADRAHDDNTMLRISSVNDTVASELVLPIAGQGSAQWQPVPFRVNGQLLLKNFSELIPHAPIESFDFRCGV
jgi:hypothetical protein